jgi:phage shock protein PspC (stress-responsive transcriptional regulator)
MQKVVSISLNGIAYQLEEPGYNQLRDYLERAEARLRDSPDRAEVMADLEQAIGEKCARLLGAHKTVVSGTEVDSILQEMGPVESAEETPADSAGAAGTASAAGIGPRKRLFQITEGAMWSGVCNGIAAYLNMDVTWVRIAFVVLTLITSGGMLIVYLALMFIVPTAKTAEDRAAAFGMPFSTEEFLGRAKKNSEESGESYQWRREWRRQQRHWQRQWNHMNTQMRQVAANSAPYMTNTARIFSGILVPAAALLGAVLFVGWILAMFSLITNHSILGWGLPHGIPLWAGILGLVVLYIAVTAPLRAIRHGGQATTARQAGWGMLHGLIWLGFTVFLFWLAYNIFPGVREIMDQLMWAASLVGTTISDTIPFGGWH